MDVSSSTSFQCRSISFVYEHKARCCFCVWDRSIFDYCSDVGDDCLLLPVDGRVDDNSRTSSLFRIRYILYKACLTSPSFQKVPRQLSPVLRAQTCDAILPLLGQILVNFQYSCRFQILSKFDASFAIVQSSAAYDSDNICI